MNFALFLVLNAVLLIRPEELYPEIAGLRLYLIVIVLCTVTSLPSLLDQLSLRTFKSFPLLVFLLGYIVLCTISVLPLSGFSDVDDLAYRCFKNGLYFLLFLANVTSVGRFKALLAAFVVIISLSALLSVLQYHGYTSFQALEPYREGSIDPSTGELNGFVRLKGSGMCSDPNDFCQMLLLGSMCCLAHAALSRNWFFSALWLAPIGLLGYAVTLTHSRGGLLAILSAIAGLVFVRLQRRTRWLLAPLVVIAGLAMVGGRQGNLGLDDSSDTSQLRIQMWAESLGDYFQKPVYWLTGLGNGYLVEEHGMVAHNSFIQAYVETGFIGGTFFLCLVTMPLLVIDQLRNPVFDGSPSGSTLEIWRLRGFVFGTLLGFAVACFSLSRNMVETSYLFMGLGACYLVLAKGSSPAWFTLDRRFLKRSALFGVLGLVGLKFFTQFMASY